MSVQIDCRPLLRSFCPQEIQRASCQKLKVELQKKQESWQSFPYNYLNRHASNVNRIAFCQDFLNYLGIVENDEAKTSRMPRMKVEFDYMLLLPVSSHTARKILCIDVRGGRNYTLKKFVEMQEKEFKERIMFLMIWRKSLSRGKK